MKNDKDPIYTTPTPLNSEPKQNKITKSSEDVYEWGKHPNSLKNIKKHQYPKGISGNVIGSKKKFEALANNLMELGEEETIDKWKKESEGTRKEQVLERIWYDAIRGDYKKISLLAWLGCLD